MASWRKYAVQENLRTHTGRTMPMGLGSVYSKLNMQKVKRENFNWGRICWHNWCQIMWTRYFLQEQGCGCNESIFYQDNKSA